MKTRIAPHPLPAVRESQRSSVSRAPGPKGLPVLGSIPRYFAQGFYRLVLDTWHQYGSPFELRLGPQHLIFLAEPSHIKQVVVARRDCYAKGKGYTDFRRGLGAGSVALDGEAWRARRILVQPFFTEKAVKQYLPSMMEVVQETVTRWQRLAETREQVDVAEEMMQLALRIIARAVFSLDVGVQAASLERDFRIVFSYIADLGSGLGALRRLVLTPGTIRFRRASERLIAFMRHQIQTHRAQIMRPADVLTHLLETRTEECPAGLSDEQIIDEAMTLIFAGSETTALALSWACYFLTTQPLVAQALKLELDEKLAGRLPTEADLAALPYTSWFWKEALRFWPPVWLFPREALAEDTFDDYRVQPGDLVMCCPYLVHHDPRFWPNPEQFDPTRFDPSQSAIAPYSYFPYGAGQRTCLGAAFANQEGVLVLASLVQFFELRLRPGFLPQPRASGTLGLARGMRMTICPRTHSGTLERVPGLKQKRIIETMKRWMSKPLDWVGMSLVWLLYTAIPKMQGRPVKPFGLDR